jgi:rhamnulokinase
VSQPYLAFDLGAESGRAISVSFEGGRLRLAEVHRFPNVPVRLPLAPAAPGAPPEATVWDVLRLWQEIKTGIRAAVAGGGPPASVGIDTWGVDYALLGADGALLGAPYNHRDPRTEGMMEQAFRRVPREEIFARTGIQFMPINTLYQLLASTLHRSSALAAARHFLTVPDLFAYWLSGRIGCEMTNATTTQCYDPRAGAWATGMLDRLGVRSDLFPEIVPPGTVLGPLRPEVAQEVGAPAQTPVIAVASHDTGSAVAALPVDPAAYGDGETFAYISSGTWSLVGGEVAAPVITPQALAFNFTNEGGIGGFRLLKNVMGLWLVQECRRTWNERGAGHSYEALTQRAAAAPPFGPLVDPDDPAFLAPGDMPRRLAAFCARSAQPALDADDPGRVTRCCLESLALKYRWVIERLERLMGRRVAVVHVIGGGSQNALLNQLTADACARPVVAGPAEATAAGNALVQAIARGEVESLAAGRHLVRRSVPLVKFEPQGTAAWDDAYGRFLRLLGD